MNQTQAMSLLRVWRALDDKAHHRKVHKGMLQDDLDTVVMLVRKHLPAGVPHPPTHNESTEIYDWLTWEWGGTKP